MELSALLVVIVGILLVFLLIGFFLLRDSLKQENSTPEKQKDTPVSDHQDTVDFVFDEEQNSDDLALEIAYEEINHNDIPKKLAEVDEELILKIERSLANVPALPTASIQIDNILRDPQVTAKQVAAFVSTNPIISSRILRTINSSFFGLSTKVTSVGRAITLLGFNNVRSMVIRDALHSSLPKSQGEEKEKNNTLWLHSSVVSACAYYLSKNVFSYHEHDLGTIGLFHDIGKYFQSYVDSTFATEVDTNTLAFSVETTLNHSQLGSLLANHWQMPEAVIKGIEYHHYPTFFSPADIPEQYILPVFIICLSDLICTVLGYSGSDTRVFPIRHDYFEKCKVSADITDLISNSLIREIEKARVAVESYLQE